MSFENLKLIEILQKSLKEEGYTTPTPIQERAIPIILERKDLLGCAQTGTGKTAAFALPILQILYTNKIVEQGKKKIKTLILTPTRELAIQIGESFTAYGKYTNIEHCVIFGGVSYRPQRNSLNKGVDILIATPGRLIDLMNQGFIDLNGLSLFVLDEADRMLDMGFINDVKKILKFIPQKRQSLFFSATMPPEIVKLAEKILHKPVKVEVTPVSSTADTIQQAVYFVDTANKKDLLIHVLKDKSIESVLIFTRTKHGADKVTRLLQQKGITAQAIHGNKSQNNRQLALNNFKNKDTRVLVATDIAARGIDIDELSHVINYEIPNISETYVHRIGRTGRAGAKGISFSFCSNEEKLFLQDIQKLISKTIPVVENHPYPIVNPKTIEQQIQEQKLAKKKNSNAKTVSNNEPTKEKAEKNPPREIEKQKKPIKYYGNKASSSDSSNNVHKGKSTSEYKKDTTSKSSKDLNSYNKPKRKSESLSTLNKPKKKLYSKSR